jgi:hypothetical protein
VPTNPVVRSFVDALNAGDKDGVYGVLAEGATLSDDGTERDLDDWLAREAFDTSGRMDVDSESPDGLSLIANYFNTRWGGMTTRWKFTVDNDKITRFETGQG